MSSLTSDLNDFFQYEENVLSERKVRHVLSHFTPSQFNNVPVRGKEFRRKMIWMGDTLEEGKCPDYKFTGSSNMPPVEPMPLIIRKLSELIKEKYSVNCNHAFITYYKDGNTRIGMHQDKHDDDFFVFSFGCTRVIQIGPKRKWDHKDNYHISLKSGSLLYVSKEGNRKFWHGINYENNVGSRISIVFRPIKKFK